MGVQKIAFLTAKSGQGPELCTALQTLETLTRQEPGCVAFTFYQAISQAEQFVLVEHFADQAAFDQHLELPHTQAFFALGLVAHVQVRPL